MPSMVPFGEFLPDAPDFKNPGCIVAENVIPVPGGYGPFYDIGEQKGTANATCRGAKLLERSTGNIITVGGGSDRLWVDVAGTVSETTGLTAIGDDAYWQFLRFGQRVLATAPNNDLQELTAIDSDTTWSAVTDAPAQAEVIGEVGSRVVVGNLASNPYGFQWSALNDPTTWTADATNYCGSGELDQRYGKITGIAGDRFAAIFQERAVSRIERIGPPSVFRITRIEEARGCLAPHSIAVVGHYTFFVSHDGFCVTNGADVRRIGSQRINRYFLNDVSEADFFRTHGAVDWRNECVVWAYYPAESPTGFVKHIIYSFAEDRWSTAVMEVDRLVESASDGVSLDGLDATYPDLDLMTISLDSAAFKAGERTLGVYVPSGTTSILYALNGQTKECRFETGEFQVVEGQRSFINKVYPLVENQSANTTASVVMRDIKGGAETVSTRGTVTTAGFCPVRGDGRYVRVRMTIPEDAAWRHAQGVQVNARASGKR